MRALLVLPLVVLVSVVARAEPRSAPAPLADGRLPLLLGLESIGLSALAGLGSLYAGLALDGFSDARSGLEDRIVPVTYLLTSVPSVARVWSVAGWTNGLWMTLAALGVRALHIASMELVFLRTEQWFAAFVVGGLLTAAIDVIGAMQLLEATPSSEQGRSEFDAEPGDRSQRRIEATRSLQADRADDRRT